MGNEKELTRYKDDLFEDLRNPEYAALYLKDANESGSIEELLMALRDVAEAYKMSVVAQTASLNRENLYKMLSDVGNPRLTSFSAILKSVGLKFDFVPIATKAADKVPSPIPAQEKTESIRADQQNNPAVVGFVPAANNNDGTAPEETLWQQGTRHSSPFVFWAAHENGNYRSQCAHCGLFFMGHKRRVICKACDAEQAPAPETCPKCGGSGEMQLEPSEYGPLACPACLGGKHG